MKRCSAPCTNNISKQDYAHDLDKTNQLFNFFEEEYTKHTH